MLENVLLYQQDSGDRQEAPSEPIVPLSHFIKPSSVPLLFPSQIQLLLCQRLIR